MHICVLARCSVPAGIAEAVISARDCPGGARPELTASGNNNNNHTATSTATATATATATTTTTTTTTTATTTSNDYDNTEIVSFRMESGQTGSSQKWRDPIPHHQLSWEKVAKCNYIYIYI